jgi:hypothetical protein
MILNRNPVEIIGGIVAMAAFIRYGWWMFRQLGKSGYTEMEDTE